MSKLDSIDIYAKIGDLKEIGYRNTLAMATLIELLVEKGLITREEFAQKAYFLDNMTVNEIKNLRIINE